MSQLQPPRDPNAASDNPLSSALLSATPRPLVISDTPRDLVVDGERFKYNYELHPKPGTERKQLLLDGVKTVKQALAAGFDAVADSFHKLFPGASTGVAVIALLANSANAAHMDSADREPAHRALGSSKPGILFVDAQTIYQDKLFTWHFTAFPIGKQVDIDGNTIKTFIYSAPHDYAKAATPSTNDYPVIAIGDGTNYITDRGRIFDNTKEEYRSPQFDLSKVNMNAGDVAVWSTTTPVPDNWIPEIAPIGTVASQYGDTAFVAGFDKLSTPATGRLPDTGACYGYYATTIKAVPGNIQPGIYATLPYHKDDPTVSYNGTSNSGGSGSPVFNSQGQLVGAVVANTDTYTSTTRSTIFANFTTPEFYNQLAPYMGIQVVPKVCAKITDVAPDGNDILVTFRAHGGSNYVVQCAPLIGSATSFSDISPEISPTLYPYGADTYTFRDVGALTNRPASFYRIKVQ